jgi:ATP-dependent DNA ligase
MASTINPMKAYNKTPAWEEIPMPCFASLKYDGVRGKVRDGVVLSNSNKPIPNKYVQFLYGRPELNGLDGELIVGYPNDANVYRTTMSAVMTIEGEPGVDFYVFDDDTHPEVPFRVRRIKVVNRAVEYNLDAVYPVNIVVQTIIRDIEELQSFEKEALDDGYEGLMVRHPDGPYKYGRSTLKQGWLLKIKRFLDSEAVVIGFTELLHNTNEPTINELGYQTRSHAMAGKIPGNTLGALIVRDIRTGVEFEIGSGFTANERQHIWQYKEEWLGRIVKYKYFPVGMHEKPRHPIFLGSRANIDLDLAETRGGL